MISALYKLYVCLLNFLPYLLPYLSTLRVGRFQARDHKRRPNLALVFRVRYLLLYILLQMHVCCCCIRLSFSVLSQKIGWKNVSEMTYFVSGGT